MPYTLSHPLAVVPIRRYSPIPLSFAALVIGSMSPDFGYFVEQFDIAAFAHTIPGTFAVCLPSSLFVLAVFYLVRRAVCFVLPEPHRSALSPLASDRPELSFRALAIMAASILVGAWTHTIWDSITHVHGWSVLRFAALREPVAIGSLQLPLYQLLQHASSIIGLGGIMLLYFRWLRSRSASEPSGRSSERWRYILLCAITFISIAIAISAACLVASRGGHVRRYEFVFRLAVYLPEAFAALLVPTAFVAFYAHGKHSRDESA
jgi:hypothetical protein